VKRRLQPPNCAMLGVCIEKLRPQIEALRKVGKMIGALLWITVIWLGTGLAVALFLDQREMKKHVPYGEAPGWVTLRLARIVFCLTAIAAWPLAVLILFFERESRK